MSVVNEHKTAILVFALSSQEELRGKKIDNADKLFRALTNHTITTVQRTGLPYFQFTEKEQVGTTFGDRFTNAILSVFDKGFEQIITIGNDSPHLKSRQILETAKRLVNDKVILGPSTDGGFYLMGIHRNNFDRTALLNLPWQNSDLFNQLTSLLSAKGIDLIQLKVLRDIDNLKDVHAILDFSNGLSTQLIKELKKFVRIQKAFSIIYILPKKSIIANANHNRGSPYILHFSLVRYS